MDEMEPFIRRAKTTLGANGSGFIDYRDFLVTYTKDNNKNFEQEAWEAGYENGKDAMSYYPETFEFRGSSVRRADTGNISHIVNALDRTRTKKKRPARRPANQPYRPANQPYRQQQRSSTTFRAPIRPSIIRTSVNNSTNNYNRPQTGYNQQSTSQRANDNYAPRSYRTEASVLKSNVQRANDNYSSNNYNRQQNSFDQQSTSYSRQQTDNYSSNNYSRQQSGYDQRSNVRNYEEEDYHANSYYQRSTAKGYDNYKEEQYGGYSNSRAQPSNQNYADYEENGARGYGTHGKDDRYEAGYSKSNGQKDEKPAPTAQSSSSTLPDPNCDYRTGEPHFDDDFDCFIPKDKSSIYGHDDRFTKTEVKSHKIEEPYYPLHRPSSPKFEKKSSRNEHDDRTKVNGYQNGSSKPDVQHYKEEPNSRSEHDDRVTTTSKQPTSIQALPKETTTNVPRHKLEPSKKSTPPVKLEDNKLFAVKAASKFDDRSSERLIDEVGDTVFKMIEEIYEQGLKKFLKHDALAAIIKKHNLDSSISLNKLKCILSLYLSESFHISAGNDIAISVKSKAVAPKSKFQIVYPLLPRKIKQQQIQFGEKYLGQILGADQEDNNLLVFLSPYIWKDAYSKLLAELSRYALIISTLQPLDFVFKSDRVLYYDKASRKFYRSVVLSGNDQKVEIFLSDEFDRVTVDIKEVYKMPARFYRYHEMAFTLKIENNGSTDKIPNIVQRLRKCVNQEHVMEVTVMSYEKFKDGAQIYAGKFGKITQGQ